ncbi:MAG: hypothetical protein NVS4B8_00780 [Herpetosiphon sp.]
MATIFTALSANNAFPCSSGTQYTAIQRRMPPYAMGPIIAAKEQKLGTVAVVHQHERHTIKTQAISLFII